jgi:RNA polymerase sigma factor (sigma-70 family)
MVETNTLALYFNYITMEINKDLQLVQQAQKGSQKAFTKLFNNYNAYILNFVAIMIKNQSNAEDVTLEVFAKAFSKIDTFNPSYNFSTWIYRIAVNTSIDYLRKKKRGPIFTDSLITEIETYVNRIPSCDFSPEDILISEQHLQRFKQLTNKMNPIFKRIMELRFEQGKSYEDIADELGLKIGTIGAQIHRARHALYKILKET